MSPCRNQANQIKKTDWWKSTTGANIEKLIRQSEMKRTLQRQKQHIRNQSNRSQLSSGINRPREIGNHRVKRALDNETQIQDRRNHLNGLLRSFKTADSSTRKLQFLSNLCNACYDKYNYQILIDIGLLDILLNIVQNNNENDEMMMASIAGVCNLVSQDGRMESKEKWNFTMIEKLTSIAASSTNAILTTNTLGILIFLCREPNILNWIRGLVARKFAGIDIDIFKKSSSIQVSNLATILADYF